MSKPYKFWYKSLSPSYFDMAMKHWGGSGILYNLLFFLNRIRRYLWEILEKGGWRYSLKPILEPTKKCYIVFWQIRDNFGILCSHIRDHDSNWETRWSSSFCICSWDLPSSSIEPLLSVLGWHFHKYIAALAVLQLFLQHRWGAGAQLKETGDLKWK